MTEVLSFSCWFPTCSGQGHFFKGDLFLSKQLEHIFAEVDAFTFRIIFIVNTKGFNLIKLVLLHIVPCLGSSVEVYNGSEVMMHFFNSV